MISKKGLNVAIAAPHIETASLSDESKKNIAEIQAMAETPEWKAFVDKMNKKYSQTEKKSKKKIPNMGGVV